MGELLHRAVQLALEVQAGSGKQLKDFERALPGHEGVAVRACLPACR
ncbi:MAG: hypothetical protein ACK4MU_08960 [Thermomonas sp.]